MGCGGILYQELCTVLRTVIRPILDYCALIYHPMLNDEPDQIVERMPARALKNIFGYQMSYSEMRKRAGVTTHRARHIKLCDKFAEKVAGSDRFPER